MPAVTGPAADSARPEPVAVLGVPRAFRGRRAYPELALVFSTFHQPLDLVVYTYLRGLGGHDEPKHPGVEHLADAFTVSERTIGRSIHRLSTEPGPHPAYLTRSRAGRRKGQTTVTVVHRDGLNLEAPWALLTDVTAGLLTPRDFQVWCALQDHTRKSADGMVRTPLKKVLAKLGSTNTTNVRVSFLWHSARRLETAGWLVLAHRPGADTLVAVATQRMDQLDRARVAAALNAARPGLVHTRNGSDRPTTGPSVDNPVDNPPVDIHSRNRRGRSTRNANDRTKV